MRYQIVKRFGEAGFAIVNGEQVYFSNESELSLNPCFNGICSASQRLKNQTEVE